MMGKNLQFFIVVLFYVLLFNGSLFAQSETKVSGLAYADYYWFAQHHNKDYKDQQGMWFRRIYLTVDHKINDAFSSRLRFEMNQPGKFGDDVSKVKMEAIVKDAFLQYKTGNHKLIAGMSGTPTWGVIEKFWGYRSVEKTMLDLHKNGASRDIGFAAKGAFDKDKKFKYHAMIGNGTSNSSEINKGKKFLASVSYYPTKSIILEAYGDYSDNEGESDQYTLQGFFGYKAQSFKLGVQYFSQVHKNTNADDDNYSGLSIFSTGAIAENWNFLARIDRLFDPSLVNEKNSYIPFAKDVKSTFFLFGADYSPVKGVKIIPNIEFIMYDEDDLGVKPDSDLITRITLAYAI